MSSKSLSRIDLKTANEIKAKIDCGAKIACKSRSELMTSAALKVADEAIMGRISFPMDDDTWTKFNQMIDEQSLYDKGFKDLLNREYR